jgi:hypothetical protein
MTQERRNELYDKTMKMLKPALERVASDPAFRNRLETNPLEALAEMNVELDADTRRELEGKRFSEFWALRRSAIEGRVGVRDLPPEGGALDDQTLDAVSGGRGMERFAPPYVPV